MNIVPMLENIVRCTALVNPDLPELLQPSLTPAQIYQIAPIPYKLPREVLLLYHWHNSTRQDPDQPEQPLFYYHEFMPIQAAYEVYQWRMQFNQEEQFEVFDPHLFPVFTFQGEYYATWCTDVEQDQSPIFFDYHGCGQVYDSLELMVTAIAECYELGAYDLEGDCYESNETAVARIKAKWNMCHHNADGTTLRDHP
ncbi:MAG: hypothetical protein MI924_24800 [Chloroflexales bacterium]|nr:hypothetical protein [Chloroflexales bacterium]